MARYWENNGQPLSDGRVCLVIDPEDGTHPLRTYGHSEKEVLEKVAKSLEHGQRMISRLREAPKPAASAQQPRAAAPAPPSMRLTADEQMTATADLGNPSKAPEAIVKLVQHATGLNLTAMQAREQEQRLAQLAEAWEANHPEFYGSLTNRKLLLNTAVLNAGGVARVSAESLEQTYQTLLAQEAFAEPGETNSSTSTPTPQVQPDGSPEPRTAVRPRNATSYRSSTLRAAAPAASFTPKYTRAQVDAANADDYLEMYRTNREFRAAADFYASNRASA